MIQTVEALSATELKVLLRDGTERWISIQDLNGKKTKR
jgi:hypothetical protein